MRKSFFLVFFFFPKTKHNPNILTFVLHGKSQMNPIVILVCTSIYYQMQSYIDVYELVHCFQLRVKGNEAVREQCT